MQLKPQKCEKISHKKKNTIFYPGAVEKVSSTLSMEWNS